MLLRQAGHMAGQAAWRVRPHKPVPSSFCSHVILLDRKWGEGGGKGGTIGLV